MLILTTLVITTSYIDAHCIEKRRNHFYRSSALISAGFQILNLIFDIFFCLKLLLYHPRYLLLMSAAFILLPITLSIGQLYVAKQQWRSLANDTVTSWLLMHSHWLNTISLLTGSAFSGVQICRSEMFGLAQFALPLNDYQIIGFQSKQLWTTVMLQVEYSLYFPSGNIRNFIFVLCSTQNVPQMALQIYFLVQFGADTIIYGAILFSALSIVSNTMTICNRRAFVKNTVCVSVHFDITSSGRGINSRRHRNRINEIRKEIAAILALDRSAVLIERPFPIRHGLRMNINIYVNQSSCDKQRNIGEIMRYFIENGDVAVIIKESWNLKEIPVISNFNFDRTLARIKMERIGGSITGVEGDEGDLVRRQTNEKNIFVQKRVDSSDSDVTVIEGNSPGDV